MFSFLLFLNLYEGILFLAGRNSTHICNKIDKSLCGIMEIKFSELEDEFTGWFYFLVTMVDGKNFLNFSVLTPTYVTE